MNMERIEALTAAFNELANEVRAHDKWAKDYNVTVETRNAEVLARSRQHGEEYDKWRQQQLDAVVSVIELFQRMEKKLDCLQGKELLSQFKAKPKRRRK